MRNWLTHAEYLIWSGWAVKRANDEWCARRPYRGQTLMDVESLHCHLYHWALEERLIDDPGRFRDMPYSYYVSLAFSTRMELVKLEARNYWRIKTQGRKRIYATQVRHPDRSQRATLPKPA
jgi:hypothetical protein